MIKDLNKIIEKAMVNFITGDDQLKEQFASYLGELIMQISAGEVKEEDYLK